MPYVDTIAPRGRIGVLVPYFNTVVEPELAALQPPGISNQVARFPFDATLIESAIDAAVKLATAHLSALTIGLAPELTAGGVELLAGTAADIERRTGVPVFTASHATHAALRVLGARTVAVVTPFDPASDASVRAAFETAGFAVEAIQSLGCPIDAIGSAPSAAIRRAFMEADAPSVDALVHVGTGLPVLHLVPDLERDLGKPVVACNAAMYWQALRAIGVTDSLSNAGRLLSAF